MAVLHQGWCWLGGHLGRVSGWYLQIQHFLQELLCFRLCTLDELRKRQCKSLSPWQSLHQIAMSEEMAYQITRAESPGKPASYPPLECVAAVHPWTALWSLPRRLAASLGFPGSRQTPLVARGGGGEGGLYMLSPKLRPIMFTSSMAISFMGIRPGSLQSRTCRNVLIGSTNTFLSLSFLSSSHWCNWCKSSGWPPLVGTWSHRPHFPDFPHPQCFPEICLGSSHISAVNCRLVSSNFIVALTCRKLSSDSTLVNSALMVTKLNFSDATSICSTAMFWLWWVFWAAQPHRYIVSFVSRPATWFLSFRNTIAGPREDCRRVGEHLGGFPIQGWPAWQGRRPENTPTCSCPPLSPPRLCP